MCCNYFTIFPFCYYYFISFTALGLLMNFSWSSSISKTPQNTRSFLMILVILSKTVVCIWEMLTSTFNSLRCFFKDLGMVPNAPTTIGTMEIFEFHNFWSSRFRSWEFSVFLCWEIWIQWSVGTAKSPIWAFLLVLSTLFMSGLFRAIIWSVWMLKSQRISKD